jgi:hypothetical protein
MIRSEAAMSGPSDPFDEASLLADAKEFDGLTDFGDEAFRIPLRMLLTSLSGAPLHAIGVRLLRGSVVWSLVSRLRARYWVKHQPEIADEVIESPLVVVGMMRSGTTLLQRMLASDARHYCALGWEVREPAPKPGIGLIEPDPRIAAAEARDEQSRRFAPDLFAIHPTYAHQAEEEIVFLADAFLSHVPEASCDVPAYRSWLDEQDFTPAYQHLHRMLQLLQWQKKQRGERRVRWVLKTPAHLGYLDTLFRVFPGAHVIHMHRDPVDTIASGASLNTTLWRMHADDVDPRKVGRQWLERMAWTNGRAMAVRDRMPGAGKRFTDVWFRDAVSDPIGQVQRIYEHVGIDFTGDARSAMTRWLAEDAREKLAAHRYTAEDFGLSRGQIREEFAGYMARFIEPHEKS